MRGWLSSTLCRMPSGITRSCRSRLRPTTSSRSSFSRICRSSVVRMDGINHGDDLGRADVLPVECEEAVGFGFAERAAAAGRFRGVEGPPAGVPDVVFVRPLREPGDPLVAVGFTTAHGALTELANPDGRRVGRGEQRSELAVEGSGGLVVALVAVADGIGVW